jgi:hypothetical protein
MKLIGDYWGWFGGRSYHHTGAVSTFYACREALKVIEVRVVTRVLREEGEEDKGARAGWWMGCAQKGGGEGRWRRERRMAAARLATHRAPSAFSPKTSNTPPLKKN